jgi:hypothetical protein
MADRPAMRERLIRLPDDLDAAVRHRAAEDDRTIAATVRVALRHWLVCPCHVSALAMAQQVVLGEDQDGEAPTG